MTTQEAAVVLSGTLIEASQVLQEFSARYLSTIEVDDRTQRIRYQFSLPLKKRPNEFGLGSVALETTKKLLVFFYQVGLGLIVTLYGGVLLLCLLGFGGDGHHQTRRLFRSLGSNRREAWLTLLGFARRVQDFVLKPSVSPTDPRGHLPAVYHFMSTNAGVLTVADVMTLTGCSYSEADRFLAWLKTVDNAEVRVNSEGTLLYIFPEFRRRGHGSVSRPDWIWNVLPKRWLSARFSSENADVLLLICLALIGSSVLEFWFAREESTRHLLRFLVADLPCAASLISLFIPMARWAVEQRSSSRRGDVLFRACILEVLHDRGEAFSMTRDFDAAANLFPGLKRREMVRNMNDVVSSMRANLTVLEDGAQAIDAPILRDEWSASLRARDRILSNGSPPGTVLKI